jgi:hypothetical protein
MNQVQTKSKSVYARRQAILTLILILSLAFLSISGCSNTAKVLIKVKVQSEIDLNKYSNIAVLPFIQVEGGKEEWGENIAYILRRQISKSGKIQVMDLKDAKEMLDGKLFIETLSDEAKLTEIGAILGVDGFITGSYKFQAISEPRTYYVERYSPRLQQYQYEPIPYIQKTYLLSIRFVMVDALTGKIILDQSYNKRDAQSHNIGSLLISSSSESETVLQGLVVSASAKFTNKIVTHYENEERVLVK